MSRRITLHTTVVLDKIFTSWSLFKCLYGNSTFFFFPKMMNLKKEKSVINVLKENVWYCYNYYLLLF